MFVLLVLFIFLSVFPTSLVVHIHYVPRSILSHFALMLQSGSSSSYYFCCLYVLVPHFTLIFTGCITVVLFVALYVVPTLVKVQSVSIYCWSESSVLNSCLPYPLCMSVELLCILFVWVPSFCSLLCLV